MLGNPALLQHTLLGLVNDRLAATGHNEASMGIICEAVNSSRLQVSQFLSKRSALHFRRCTAKTLIEYHYQVIRLVLGKPNEF